LGGGEQPLLGLKPEFDILAGGSAIFFPHLMRQEGDVIMTWVWRLNGILHN
jgi:hypothetical protein